MHAESNESFSKAELSLIVEASAATLDQTTLKSLQSGEMSVAHGLSVDFKAARVRYMHSPSVFSKLLYLGR